MSGFGGLEERALARFSKSTLGRALEGALRGGFSGQLGAVVDHDLAVLLC